MRVSSLLALPLLSLFTFAQANPDNSTLGHRVARHNVGASVNYNYNNGQGSVDKSNWKQLKCSLVAGKYAGHSFNFGCLCLSDVDDFCKNNNVNSYIKLLLSNYINANGHSAMYPPNAQPTCYNGGYDCGSLSKKSDGTCGSTSCHPNTCSSNGGCCPRGQTYENGKCCARTGCNREKTCTPILTCSTYSSNGVCCADATGKDWVGQKTRCCPKNQVEIDGKCSCPAGTKASGSSCVSICPSGQQWGESMCCSLDSTEKNGKCVCNSDQHAYNSGNGKCENVCPGSQTFYPSAKACCPVGATYKNGGCDCGPQADLKGKDKDMFCQPKCPGNQVKVGGQGCPSSVTRLVGGKCDCGAQADLQGSGNTLVCKNKCDNGFTFYTNKCCPAGATQVGNDCKCSSPAQELTTVNGKSQCTDKCKDDTKWCNKRCCPRFLEEDASGNCACADEAYTPDYTRKQCAPKCLSSEKYNYNTHKCESICDESAGYYYKKGFLGHGFCCRKTESACSTRCCPAGTVEIGTTGKCCKEGSTVVNGKCVEPTTKPKARSLVGRMFGEQLPIAPSPSSYGIEENRNGTLCPATLAACPIEGSDGLFECLDTSSDLQSCGGCPGLGHGSDCTILPGARWMGCNSGVCEVYSCKKGWRRNADRSACVKMAK